MAIPQETKEPVRILPLLRLIPVILTAAAAGAGPLRAARHLFGAVAAAALSGSLLAHLPLLVRAALAGQLGLLELRQAAAAEGLALATLALAARAKSSSPSSPAKERSCQLSL